MIERKTLGLAEAEKAIQAMLEEAAKDLRPMAVAVVDAWGNLISFARMDGASPLMARMATNKAYTASSFGIDTRNINQWFKGSGKDISWYDDHRLTVVHGGVCVRSGNTVVGGIGASGRHEDEDEALAIVGKESLTDYL